MRTYEAMCVFRPEDEVFREQKEAVTGELAKLNATVVKEEDMGVKTLAYPIDKVTQGHYYLFVVELEPAQVSEVERAVKLRTELLRLMIVRREE